MSSIRSNWTTTVLLWNWTVYRGEGHFLLFMHAVNHLVWDLRGRENKINYYRNFWHRNRFEIPILNPSRLLLLFSYCLFFVVIKFYRLLHTQVAFCCFTDANKSQTEANEIIEKIGIEKVPMNLLITYYKALSMLYFAKSDYNLSYDWSVKALQLLGPKTPDK